MDEKVHACVCTFMALVMSTKVLIHLLGNFTDSCLLSYWLIPIHRTGSSMEDSTATTIEFLRARLLSERSVSRSARQRAEELAKRVAELEEQLRIVSLQRMKAEKATANVLAILESNEISDHSETYDSNSDQDTTSESKVGNKASKAEEGLVSSKVRKYELEHSGSGHDCPPAQGRSLSWKGRKHSQRSLEKYKDPSLRRRSGFASTSSSPKHRQGKSCRQIRSKESRSTIEEFRANPIKVDSPENGVANTSEDFPNCLEPEHGRIEDGEEKALTENPISGHLENGQHAHSNELEDDAYSSDRDMEKALEHQAQLIDQYEAMEKAQREWEEKFRENNGSTPDSYDPGNRSDVIKEGYEIKVQAPHHAGTIAAQFSGAKSEVENASNIKPNDILPPSHVNIRQLQEWKSSSTPASETSDQDFAFYAEKQNQNQNQESIGNNHYPSPHGSHHHPLSHSSYDSPGSQSATAGFSKGKVSGRQNASSIQPNGILPPSHVNTRQLQEWGSSSTPASETSDQDFAFYAVKQKQNQESIGNNHYPSPHSSHHHPLSYGSYDSPGSQSATGGFSKGKASGRQNELYALVPHKASNELGSVLDALKQARQSLQQKTNPLPLVEGGSIRNSVDPSLPAPVLGGKVDIPLESVGLFRLPTDFLVEDSMRTNFLSSNTPIGLGNHYPDTGLPAATSNQFVSRSYSASGTRFPTEDRFLTSQYVEDGSRIFTQRPYFDPYLDSVLPSSGRYTYPTNSSYPDQIPLLPSREFPSFLPSRTTGIPPANHFLFSDDHTRPNMYR
ncbi:hypothetical protein POTOM_038948 [Populus tomentosa]|uniref:Uncharacterized protein n=1 Tax=Populus tomentosa TaxID=118781 RepID=A0A8X8CLR6_POPTO|nr:hypothetical protein POTOM_038948 [Populus tomentosa]